MTRKDFGIMRKGAIGKSVQSSNSDNLLINSMPLAIQINLSSLNSNTLVYKYNLYDKINNKTYIDNLEIYEFNITKIKETCYNKSSKYRLLSLLDCNKEALIY